MGSAILVAGRVHAWAAVGLVIVVVIVIGVIIVVVIVVIIIVVILGVGATVRHRTAVQAPVCAVAEYGVAPSGSVWECARR
jgi:hypothetical protein